MIDKEIGLNGETVWRYTDGCFTDGNPGKYVKAEPGEIYHGESIRIEVRDSHDPYIAAVKAVGEEIQFSTSFRLLSFLSLLLLLTEIVLGCLALYNLHKLKKQDNPYAA
jgi:hypothetical protein